MKNKTKHLYTASELFRVIMDQLKEEGKIPDGLLDYALATDTLYEFRDYGFDILGKVNYGGSEGIYVDLYFKGDIGDPQGRRLGELGTIKTLDESDDAFRKMAVLMADFQIAATRFVNRHLDDFTWLGFDIDYYRQGEGKSCYGVTCKGYKVIDEAVKEAKRMLKACRDKYRYACAVVTDNRTGKTEVVGAYDKSELHYFKLDLVRILPCPPDGHDDSELRGFDLVLDEKSDQPEENPCFIGVIRGLREPTVDEAEEFVREFRETWFGPEQILHVEGVKEIPYSNVERDFVIPSEDNWPIFGLDERRAEDV